LTFGTTYEAALREDPEGFWSQSRIACRLAFEGVNQPVQIVDRRSVERHDDIARLQPRRGGRRPFRWTDDRSAAWSGSAELAGLVLGEIARVAAEPSLLLVLCPYGAPGHQSNQQQQRTHAPRSLSSVTMLHRHSVNNMTPTD
jgi:hypothetical protein